MLLTWLSAVTDTWRTLELTRVHDVPSGKVTVISCLLQSWSIIKKNITNIHRYLIFYPSLINVKQFHDKITIKSIVCLFLNQSTFGN